MKRLLLSGLLSCMVLGQASAADTSHVATGVINGAFCSAAAVAVVAALAWKFQETPSPTMGIIKPVVVFLFGLLPALNAQKHERINEAQGSFMAAFMVAGLYGIVNIATALEKMVGRC